MGGKRIDARFLYGANHSDRHQAGKSRLPREFFGPVALFFRVKDEDAAIALANDSDFGWRFRFTKDIARGKRVASRVETGMMFINNISWSDAELPFGGIKDSGYGASLVTWHSGIREQEAGSLCGRRGAVRPSYPKQPPPLAPWSIPDFGDASSVAAVAN